MLPEKVEKAINKQIHEEFYSSYLYLSMSAYASSVGLEGLSNWMKIQAQEELTHAMKFFNYVNERGGRAELMSIEKPQIEWESPVDVFNATLKHEQHITSCINELMNLALEEKDHASLSFFKWFIDEQVEEEASAQSIVDKLKLTGGTGHALFMIDAELAKRVFVPPTTTV